MSSGACFRVVAPARWVTSASPVASMTRLAKIASRPALLSTMAPTIRSPSIRGATNIRWSIGVMPASDTRVSATHLKASPSIAWLSDCGSSTAAPALTARCSNSMPRPSLSTVFSWRYQAKPSTPTAVMLPPKQPKRSSSVTSTPDRAAAMAAASPPGPDPMTSTSV